MKYAITATLKLKWKTK